VPATDLIAFVRATLPPPPARVLEIGAGDGELAAALTTAGYEVVAIDPASEVENVQRVALHELDEQPFDVAVAVVSLHHIEPLGESFERLAALVRSGGLLVVDEVDFGRLDERAVRWWLARSGHAAEPADVLGVRDHMHSLARLCEVLQAHFELGEPVRGAYLYRWSMPTDVRAEEEAGIAAGDIPAMGARMVGIRRP
jgi:2-polyprenyl-3-methyl-5-hydroxy-6-metoxy-1,4-benzoquinol methylase